MTSIEKKQGEAYTVIKGRGMEDKQQSCAKKRGIREKKAGGREESRKDKQRTRGKQKKRD